MKKNKLLDLYFNRKYRITQFTNGRLDLLECKIFGIDLEITGYQISKNGDKQVVGVSLVYNSNIPNYIRRLVEKEKIFDVKLLNRKYVIE